MSIEIVTSEDGRKFRVFDAGTEDEWREEIQTEFEIPVDHMPELETRFAKLAKRAAKLGCDPPTFELIGKPYVVKYERNPLTDEVLDFPVYVYYQKIKVHGEAPRFSGWSFLGIIEPVGKDKNLIRTLPGVELPEKYRTEAMTCDHCHSNRKRKSTFVCRHEEDGRMVRVGSTCLADFLGGADPERIAGALEWFFRVYRDIESDYADKEWGPGTGARPDLSTVLAATSVCIRTWGWSSRTLAAQRGGTSTADDVAHYLFDGPESKELRKDHPITDEDRKAAEDAIAWAQTLGGSGSTDYEHNVSLIAALEGGIQGRHMGIACSILPAHRRSLELQAERAALEIKAESEWISEVGKRIDIQGVVSGIHYTETDYGTMCILRFLFNDGRDRAVWFTNRNYGLMEGMMVHLKATVKDHALYQGRKQTVLTRGKVLGCWI
jgi:hypothetical protein